MDERKDRIQAKIRQMLDARPGASTDELQEAALQINPALATLSRRQFNAGYVLPEKRARSAADGTRKPRAARGTRGRRKGKARKAKAAAATTAAPTTRRRRGTAAAPVSASTAGGGERDRVREVLLRFARDLTRAESRAEIIDLLGSLDTYVDDALAAAR